MFETDEHWKCKIPTGKIGMAEIQKFEVSQSASNFQAMRREWVPPGNYTRLITHGQLMMSDTPQEMRDHVIFFWRAHGHVLIHGLGLGCCLDVVRHMESVKKVTVIEISQDVIDLVGSHFEKDPNVEIIHADALVWKAPKDVRFGAVWHDIWANMCEDNKPEMTRLSRRYGQKTDWQGCWARERMERNLR